MVCVQQLAYGIKTIAEKPAPPACACCLTHADRRRAAPFFMVLFLRETVQKVSIRSQMVQIVFRVVSIPNSLYYIMVTQETITTMNSTVEAQDNQLALSFASISGRQVEAVFDGGVLTSDMGVMVLREVASRSGIVTDRRGVNGQSASELR